MLRSEKLEVKVGLFIGVGIFLMFLLVFSISDLYLLKGGYNIITEFDFVNGITENAPVRLAGVNVGEIKKTDIFYDEEKQRTRVGLTVWINDGVQVETDAVARINTLGLLGEQYLEITPGKEKTFLEDGSVIVGRNPVNVGEQMEGMNDLIDSFNSVMKNVEDGEGTLGKLLSDDTLYNELSSIFKKINSGEGTVGKLLSDDKIYNDLETFVSDIKAHPWKLLSKPRRTKDKRTDDK
ncbi:MAG: MlaD family protein [Candidatus Aadella gelida]|nr:MlaD family protein [Candidatus Aadella gelida]